MMDYTSAALALLALNALVLCILHLDLRRRDRQYPRWKNALAEAFREWHNEADWEGYREIPATMYFDLVDRLVQALAAAQDKEQG